MWFYHVVAFMTVAIWGSTFISTKVLIQSGISPAQVYTLRFLIAYVLMLLFFHKHIFARVGVHHKSENALYPLPFLFIHICGPAPAVSNFKPVHSLLFDVPADLVVALLGAG